MFTKPLFLYLNDGCVNDIKTGTGRYRPAIGDGVQDAENAWILYDVDAKLE